MDNLTHDKGLKIWRDARPSLKANHRVFFQNIIEELLEPLYTKETVKRMTQEILEKYYAAGIEPASENAILDSINDIEVFSINEVELMGYDNNKCMEETVKEISSRKGAVPEGGGKWLKYEDDYHKSLWYKADYDECKR